MKHLASAIGYMACGALLFWPPDIGTHVIAKYEFAGKEVSLLTVLLPSITVLAYVVMHQLARGRMKGPSVAGFMALGIWVAGPLATMIGASFRGGGFATPGTWPFVIIATIFFLPFTFMMSTYDGTLGALFLSSVFLAVMHIRFERTHWILPPFIWNRVKRAFGVTKI